MRKAKANFPELAITRESASITWFWQTLEGSQKSWEALMVDKEQAQVLPGCWPGETGGGLTGWGTSYVIGWDICFSLADPKLQVHGTGGQILGQLAVIIVISLGHCGTIVTGRLSYCLAS